MTKEYTKARREKDENIVKYVESHRVNLNNSYDDIEEKMCLLEKVCNWKNLRVGSNISGSTFLPIRKCADKRINMTAKKTYEDAKLRLSKNKEDVWKEGYLNFE